MYRLKHIPSGLYFIPARRIKGPGDRGIIFDYIKSNLSKTGKIYHRKPSIRSQLGEGTYYDHTKCANITAPYLDERFLHPVIESEWEVEEIQ